MLGGKPPGECTCAACKVLVRLRRDLHAPGTPVWAGTAIVDRLRALHGEVLDLRESGGLPATPPLVPPVAEGVAGEKGVEELPKPPGQREETSGKKRSEKERSDKHERKKDKKKDKKDKKRGKEPEDKRTSSPCGINEELEKDHGRGGYSPLSGTGTASSSGLRTGGDRRATPPREEEEAELTRDKAEDYYEGEEEEVVEEDETVENPRHRDRRQRERDRRGRGRDSRSRSPRSRSPLPRERHRRGSEKPPEPPGPPPSLRERGADRGDDRELRVIPAAKNNPALRPRDSPPKGRGKGKRKGKAKRAKGIKRRVRNQDIAFYGCDSRRKEYLWG